jgi:hypothetical protein
VNRTFRIPRLLWGVVSDQRCANARRDCRGSVACMKGTLDKHADDVMVRLHASQRQVYDVKLETCKHVCSTSKGLCTNHCIRCLNLSSRALSRPAEKYGL